MVVGKILKWSAFGSGVGVSGFFWATRQSVMHQLPRTDYLYNTTWYARYNAENNPCLSDVCVRRVPLNEIQPDLLEKPGKLVERYCAGVWGGIGYAYQRRFLEKKYRGPATASHLWDRPELKDATYPVGTKITDHFEILGHTEDSIIIRAGDSPKNLEPRASDGLIELKTEIKKDEGVAEFQFKCVFYQGVGQAEGPVMPWHVEKLHQWYSKLLTETAVRTLLR